MPKYISKAGLWHPMKEKCALKNYSEKPIEYPVGSGKFIQPGEDFIYEGPDRAAMFELFKAKQETFGMDFHKDPELINRVRQLGYKSVEAYAKDVGYDEDFEQKRFDELSSKVNMHEMPAKVAAIEVMSGGDDSTGGGADRKGEWAMPKEL